jgi:hypothetical protein
MLALLNELRDTAHEFAAREEKLNTDFQAGRSAEENSFEAAAEGQRLELSRAIAAAEVRFLPEIEACHAGFERRKQRINQGHMSARKRAMQAIRQQEAQRKYKIQQSTMEAERRREASLADAAARHEQFEVQLNESREAFGLGENAVRSAFGGYASLQKRLHPDTQADGPDPSADENQLLEQLHQLQAKTGDDLRRLRKMWLLALFKFFPGWFLVLLALLGGGVLLLAHYRGVNDLSLREAGAGLAGAVLLLAGGRALVKRRDGPMATAIAGDLAATRRLHEACFERARVRYENEQARIKNEYVETIQRLDQEWKQAVKEALDLFDVRPRQIDEQAARVARKNEELHAANVGRIEGKHAEAGARLQQEGEARARQLTDAHAAKLIRLDTDYQTGWQQLEAEWGQRVRPIYATIQAASTRQNSGGWRWTSGSWWRSRRKTSAWPSRGRTLFPFP